MRYFDLEGREIDEQRFLALYQSQPLRILHQTVLGDCKVSTVWLGIDHNFDPSGPPLIFETMVFGGPLHDLVRRYSTKELALTGHEEVVALVGLERQFA